MQSQKQSVSSFALMTIFKSTIPIMAIFATFFWSGAGAAAQTEKILHSFGSKTNDGVVPFAGLVFDGLGNLYGTTTSGGTDGLGTLFELSPAANGGWSEKILFNFHRIRPGVNPMGGLVFDSSGNLYGTAHEGGIYTKGVVFELRHWPDGGWSEEVLYDFGAEDGDGQFPTSGVVFDASGNLFGTTQTGGVYHNGNFGGSQGTLYELSPAADGSWTEKVLHSFGNGTDGASPHGTVVFDAAGNLYGTTLNGGTLHQGTVYELSPASDGSWTEKVLYNFGTVGNGTVGTHPEDGVIFDGAGNLYGTAEYGGVLDHQPARLGTVFELSPQADGSWKATGLHSFSGGGGGNYPLAGLTFDASGNLYGTTFGGGHYGTVFKMTPVVGAGWNYSVLHSFDSVAGDGFEPLSRVILDALGNVYGTTENGGHYGKFGYGTVFEITPSPEHLAPRENEMQPRCIGAWGTNTLSRGK